jgi:hypothetical protein
MFKDEPFEIKINAEMYNSNAEIYHSRKCRGKIWGRTQGL